MKASKKIISIILAVVMMFSAVSVSAFAAIVPDNSKTSIETLIKNDNLATLVKNLLSNLNGAKKNLTGTVLKLVFTFMDDDTLTPVIEKVAAGKAVVDLSDEQLAKILLDWLDANLPTWTSGITEESWYGTVQGVVKVLGVTLNLSSVDGVIKTVYDVCTASILNLAGDLGKLNGDALKGVKRSGGDLKVVYALFQWINDNADLIAKFVKGGIGSNGLSIGSIFNDVLGDSLADINNMIKNIPDFAKSYIYLLIDGKAAAGDIKKDAKGAWGKSAYASYNADQMLAAAVIRLIQGKEVEEIVSKADCDAALKLSFYDLLAKYGKELYARFAVEPLNTSLKDLLGQLKDFEDTKDIFNYDYNFTAATFDAAFADIGTKGVVAQLNNILCTIMKTIMNANVYNSIGFETGDNSKLNTNFTKACRYILPILAKHSEDLGVDFTSFTAEAVKDMGAPDMAVAVLKIFFPGWFKDNYNADLVNNAKTVAQLGALAVYFTATNTNWITLDNGYSVDEYTKAFSAGNIATLADDECVELMVSMGAKMGVYALDAAKAKTYFVMDKSANTWQAYINNIVDWAIKFAKGIPAVMVDAGVYNTTEDAFYKVNVALNELFNFNFLSNVGDNSFALDTETLIFDSFLKNLFKFDIDAAFSIIAKNSNPGNILNEGTVISSILGVVDRLLSAVFTHTCGTQKTFTEDLSCTEARTITYCSKNGHYIGTPKAVAINKHDHQVTSTVAATCGKTGLKTLTCTKCGDVKTEVIAKLPASAHKNVIDTSVPSSATCTTPGMVAWVCSVCGAKSSSLSGALGHDLDAKGICKRCGYDSNHVHKYTTKVVKKATATADGQKQSVCSCGDVKSTTTIKKASNITLSASTYTYDGTAKKPTVTVKTSSGTTLKKDTDYTVTYTNNTAIGKASVKVTFKGSNYSGSKTLNFTINPKNVTGAKVASQTDTTVKLSWTAVKGAAGYNVYKLASGKYTLVGSSTTNSYTVKSLKAATSYTYYVKAYKTVSGTTYTSASYTKVAATTAPAQVKGLKVSSQTTTSIKLTWTKVTGAKYYKVEKSEDGKKWTVVTSATSATSYTVSKLTAGKSYQFRVTALDSTKKIAGKASAVLKAATLTSAPVVTLKSAKSKTATATWKKVTGATKYVVSKSTDGKKWSKVTTTTKTTYDLTKLTGGKKIYVKVTALNADGKESAASTVKNVTVKK